MTEMRPAKIWNVENRYVVTESQHLSLVHCLVIRFERLLDRHMTIYVYMLYVILIRYVKS